MIVVKCDLCHGELSPESAIHVRVPRYCKYPHIRDRDTLLIHTEMKVLDADLCGICAARMAQQFDIVRMEGSPKDEESRN